MNVVLGNMPLDNLNIFRFANLTDQSSYSFSNISPQDWLAVLGYPNKVILYIVNGMAGFTIILHAASILKSSPEGEGFSPIPRVGQ